MIKARRLTRRAGSLHGGRSRVSFARNRFAALLLMLVAGLCLMPSSAKAWWNDDWSLRKKITVDTSSSGANITEPIGEMPVLIRLHVGNFRFAQAKEDGSDLRFVAGDDKTPLKHHVEKFDSLLGEALVWVKVPDLKPGAKTDVWLYYGNKKAVAVNDPKGTYDVDTTLIYHFNERGTPPQDFFGMGERRAKLRPTSGWRHHRSWSQARWRAHADLAGVAIACDGKQRATDLVGLDQAGLTATQCRTL
ncbi:MAG: DUF2341 domain-containing protein [Bradyrhizobium sp.]